MTVGELENEFAWLSRSLNYIDFSMKQYLSDCLIISILTKGGMTKDIIDKLSFEEYQFVIDEAISINKEIYKDG